MERIRLSRTRRRALIKWAKKQDDSRLLWRVLAVAGVAAGRKVAKVAEELACARSFVYRVVARYLEEGREALFDGRAWNGQSKTDDAFRSEVRELIRGTPRDHGYIRNTWTRELLALVMESRGYTRVSANTMGRVLAALRARLGRPKPIVKCPLSARQKRRRLRHVRNLINDCPEDEVVVYEDEVDIHLNPKMGVDWMNLGEQKHVLTPGQNAKGYVAGTLDAHTREIVWVGGGCKTSELFIALLAKLDAHYDDASLIHIVLDNYIIHKSHMTLSALEAFPRIKLHFLPPYCPDHNPIERLWRDLHAQVTRNHPHAKLVALCEDVTRFLDAVSPWIPGGRPPLLKAS